MRWTSSEAAERCEYGYDVAPYRGTSEPLAHASRLEVIAALRGLSPAPPATARVLELGCGTGANLLPLAIEYPNATIVGCDLAVSAVRTARGMAEELGLTNVEFRHADLNDVDDGWGEFDYIVCHDVFSWVAPDVRQKILRIQARNLAPQGVGYLSHDVQPGWHLHDIVLDMVRFHTRGVAGFRQRVDQARGWIAMALQTEDQLSGAYGSLIRDECWLLGSIPDEHLYHLVSGAPHRAFYFHEFLQAVEQTNLKWIADADPGRDRARSLVSEGIRPFLAQPPDRDQQQHLDFLGKRSFRRAVLCRADTPLGRSFDPRVVRRSWVGLAHSAVLTTPDDTGEMCLGSSARDGDTFCSTDVAVGDALRRLHRERPEFVPFSELFAPDCDEGIDFLMAAFAIGIVDIVLSPCMLTNRITDTPTVSPLVRLEARLGAVVTNRKSEPVRLNEPMRFVVQRLDGRHDLAGLAQAIDENRKVDDPRADCPSPFADLSMTAPEIADHCLRRARDHALLIDSSPHGVLA